jgi:Tol biopolymer transport system component
LFIDRTREAANMLDSGVGCPAFQPSISADGRTVAFLAIRDCQDSPAAMPPRSLWVHNVREHSYEEVPLERMADSVAANQLVQLNSPRVSQTGRFVTFIGSTGRGPGPHTPILVYDRSTEIVFAASQGYDGQPANKPCYNAVVSEAAHCVLFASGGSNLVHGDENETFDIFLYDWTTNQTECLSASGPGATGNGTSLECDMSEDGSVVAFVSTASNLVVGDHNQAADIFLWQR